MPQNIMINNVRKIKCKLMYDQYYDFMLYKGHCNSYYTKLDDIASLDFSKLKDIKSKIYSDNIWSGAINEGVILNNFGYTGVDNGQITYRKDWISNEEFLKIYTESKLDIPEGDLRFFMSPVSGNTKEYVYPIEKVDDYVKMTGGFYQGFFKLKDEKYQTLPSRIEDRWRFCFNLRRRDDYPIEKNTLNDYIEENNGFFFYIGTRAENKFWPFYKKDEKKLEEFYDGCREKDDYFSDENVNRSEMTRNKEYLVEREPDFGYNADCGCVGGKCNNDKYFSDGYFSNGDEYDCDRIDGYFADNYTGPNSITCQCFDPDYFKPELDLDEVELKTGEGYDFEQRKFTRFTTDNKFIFFNCTPTGFTTDNWVEGTEVELERNQDYDNINYFPLLNYTPTGYTVDTLSKLHKENENVYKIVGDLYRNALGFKINKDGSIIYRYMVMDCENEPTFIGFEEESTAPGLVKDGEWTDICIDLINLSPYNECKVDKNSKMKIEIRVNGKLKFISKELPMIDLRPLNDSSEKQETVPYNISVGGGTQGLAEAIYLDYYNYLDYTLPLEKYFGGTFIGDLKSFSFSL